MNAKESARRLKVALQDVAHVDLPHKTALEVTARQLGYRHWHELQTIQQRQDHIQVSPCGVTVSLNDNQHTHTHWDGEAKRLLHVLARRASPDGRVEVAALELGELLYPHTSLSAHQAYARGLQFLLEYENYAAFQLLHISPKHRGHHVLQLNLRSIFPERDAHMSINLHPAEINRLISLGEAALYYLWLLGRSERREDHRVIHRHGESQTDEAAHRGFLVKNGWIEFEQHGDLIHVTLPHVRHQYNDF